MATAEYLTTREVAELLRLKERKIYDLAATGTIPCSRATGKLLFPRQAIEQWLRDHASGTSEAAGPPNVILGSHDPLLEWALREAQLDVATRFDASADGLDRLERNEGIATGLHLYDAESTSWNRHAVEHRFAGKNVVLVEWAWRERGLLLKLDAKPGIDAITDLAGRRFVPRQGGAGAQTLFEQLLRASGIGPDDIDLAAPARSEVDAALAVQSGTADAAFGLKTLARQLGLGFVPMIRERFDLLIDRKFWFEAELQTLMTFTATHSFRNKADELGGYDISGLGQVQFNA